MAKADFLKTDESGQAAQFILFRDNITPHLATYELLNGAVPVAEVTQQAEDATYFRAMVDFNGSMQQAAQGWTAFPTAKEANRRNAVGLFCATVEVEK